MTTCDDAIQLLSRGLDGDLNGGEAVLMYAHVARCEACRRAMGEFAALARALEAFSRHLDTVSPGSGSAAAPTADADSGQTEDGGEQLRRFIRHAARDDALRKQLRAAPDGDGFARLCVQLGREHGYTFSAGQVKSRLGNEAANDGELDDAQLDRVAAGTGFSGQTPFDLLEGLTLAISGISEDE